MSHATMTKVDFSKRGSGGKQEKELIIHRSGWKSFGFICFSGFQILAMLIVMGITIAIISENILSQLLAQCGIGWILFCAFNALRGFYNCLILHEPIVMLQSNGLLYQEMEITDTGMNKALVITVLVEEEVFLMEPNVFSLTPGKQLEDLEVMEGEKIKEDASRNKYTCFKVKYTWANATLVGESIK